MLPLVATSDVLSEKEKKNSVSSYTPSSPEMRERLEQIARDGQTCQSVRDQTFEEFDFCSLDDTINRVRYQYNENKPPKEGWKSNIVRPMTRNKIRSTVAHFLSGTLYPSIIAQNDQQDEDREMAEIMRDCVTWALDQDNYAQKILDFCTTATVDPGVFVHQGFYDVRRKIKELTKGGGYTKKEVMDEVFSGFKLNLVPVEDLYILNPYEQDLQKQGVLFWRRFIDYSEAQIKYGSLPLFPYVRPGYRTSYLESEGMFFDVKDDELMGRLVEEVIYYNRSADLEIVMLGGIPIHDDPERPMQRMDKCYPFAYTGYERYNGRFFYYRSLVANLTGLQEEIDIMHRMVIDGSMLNMFPPTALIGETDQPTADVFVPGQAFAIPNPSASVQPIQMGNTNSGFQMLSKLEEEASETSVSSFQGGTPLAGDRTKYEIQALEENAARNLGVFGRNISSMVEQIGKLTVGSILQHMPIAEIGELTSGELTAKLATILVKKESDTGAKTKKIVFDPEFPEEVDAQDAVEMSLLEGNSTYKNGKVEANRSIAIVNPEVFKKMKYMVQVKAEFDSRSIELKKRLAFIDRAINNPAFDQREVALLMAKLFVPDAIDTVLAKEEQKALEAPQAPGPQQAQGLPGLPTTEPQPV